jgi:hypothetical protein
VVCKTQIALKPDNIDRCFIGAPGKNIHTVTTNPSLDCLN